MAEITAALVKELRERTGAGMMDCKKALAATEGDMDKAIDFLREKETVFSDGDRHAFLWCKRGMSFIFKEIVL